MLDKAFWILVIDPEFRDLIRPLRRVEYNQLEASLNLYGCQDPLVVWNNTLIDGHNRYEICNRRHIPYAIREMNFISRDEVIAWICSNQLGRRNIAEETRKYLIGKQYEAEKRMGNPGCGHNQYTYLDTDGDESEAEQRITSRRTAERLAEEHHISHATVQKYARYSNAIDEIGKKTTSLVPQILAGNVKFSHDHIVDLAQMPTEQLKQVEQKANQSLPKMISKTFMVPTSTNHPKSVKTMVGDLPAIKSMPTFDPDAEIVGLALTIPSWVSSVRRTKNAAKVDMVSAKAKERITVALIELQSVAQEMLDAIKGEN